MFDSEHPRPKDATDAVGLRKYMTKASDKQLAVLRPKDTESLKEFRHVVGTGLEVMIHDRVPIANELVGQKDIGGVLMLKLVMIRPKTHEQIPIIHLRPEGWDETIMIWIHPEGKQSLFEKGKLVPAAQIALKNKAAIWAPDLFLTGEFQGAKGLSVDQNYAGFSFGYNRPLLANRIHDILGIVTPGPLRKAPEFGKKIRLVGFGKAGPWVLLARGLCGGAVARTVVDANQFDFDQVKTTSEETMLPGALKYGGLPSFAALCAPRELYLHNVRASPRNEWIKDAYKTAGAADKLQMFHEKMPDEKVVEWLLR